MSEAFNPQFPSGFNPQFPEGAGSGDPPVLLFTQILSRRDRITLTFDVPVEIGSGGSGGLVLTSDGDAVTVSGGPIGGGTTKLTFTLSRVTLDTETITLDYTQPGDGIEGTGLGTDLASFADEPVAFASIGGSGMGGNIFNDFSVSFGGVR